MLFTLLWFFRRVAGVGSRHEHVNLRVGFSTDVGNGSVAQTVNDNAVVIGADALANLVAGFARFAGDIAVGLLGNDVFVAIGSGVFSIVILPAQVAQTVVLFNGGFVVELTNFRAGKSGVLEVLSSPLLIKETVLEAPDLLVGRATTDASAPTAQRRYSSVVSQVKMVLAVPSLMPSNVVLEPG